MSDHVDVADSVLKSSQRYTTFGRILDWVRGISRVVSATVLLNDCGIQVNLSILCVHLNFRLIQSLSTLLCC